ncbi:MAG: YgiQ family radical SAM protein, partial [Synergistaceae bacterium]|nr:YgiQ family radical SAM protein [Synergistaceae bacterium]
MKNRRARSEFLPVSSEDMSLRGWKELDFLCVTGDAYVDHPSFGISVVSRVLESMGFRVGIVAQPDWRGTDDFAVMGRPRLGVLVSAGNLDSMLSNYSSPGKRRARDDYAPDGEPGRRPDRAAIVYCNRIREIWGPIPLIIGGIEASLRRMAHYDYWSDAVRRSILADSRADLLIYGMAEHQLGLTARRMALGAPIRKIRDVPGTCWKTHGEILTGDLRGSVEIPSFAAVSENKEAFTDAFRIFYGEQNFASGRAIAQDQGSWTVVQNPPAPPLATESMDKIYSLPYARAPHPMYADKKIPAFAEVSFSVTSHRGC